MLKTEETVESEDADSEHAAYARRLLQAAGMKAKANINLQEAIDIFRRQKVREVVFYACFLLLFTTSTYLQRDVHDAYNYVDTGGGYAIDIPVNYTRGEVLSMFKYLESQRWTDRKTRAVMFDINLYNPFFNYFLSLRLLFEFTFYGKVVPDVFEWNALGARFWRNPWKWLNLMMYLVFFISLAFRIQFLIISIPYVNSSQQKDDKFAELDFENLGWIYSQIWNWTSFNSIFVWGRAFSFSKFTNDRFANISYTIFKSYDDLTTLLVVIFFCNIVFGVSFFVAYGIDVSNFSSFLDSCYEQYKMMMRGDNNFTSLMQSNAILASFLLFLFQIICTFGLVRISSAILNQKFMQVSRNGIDDPMATKFRSMMKKLILRRFRAMFYWGKKTDTDRFNEEREKEYEELLLMPSLDRDWEELQEVREKLGKFELKVTELSSLVETLETRVALLSKFLSDENSSGAAGKSPKHAWKDEGDGGPEEEGEYVALAGNKAILPPHWRLEHDDKGNKFYYNTITRTSQWDPPVVYIHKRHVR
ncbi:hypothetical protein GUITHDRAFT_103936 [Guillardia theta CCMP2712]|uniref:WW domain-containing protein n=1 Tax=Guillardia theta (strain CCMP2712) TaxID=905079 RepID=L1JNT6_GUITC|nr:hypothetical protein GUITHDRAFT_103936 [Guillardia theta CCMP2712]EKX50122.1 hypothetical protein GUITHDRAFT_103936 [Guillardia theta CCMP2712]|eukprot:XP_005837102.1 hypothetical protein GUITHDRAFT_103936 [Guillardia theta CCMP2712]